MRRTMAPIRSRNSPPAAPVLSSPPPGFSQPWGLAFDRAGNLYVANQGSNTIAKVPPAGGTGTVFASGLSAPYLIAVAPVRSSTVLAAGFSTPIPGGSGNFIAFPNAPSLSGDSVAFVGNGAGGAQGIYAKFGVIAPPQRIADLTTPIPSGSGNFTSFYPGDPRIPGEPTVSGNNVAFVGQAAAASRASTPNSASLRRPRLSPTPPHRFQTASGTSRPFQVRRASAVTMSPSSAMAPARTRRVCPNRRHHAAPGCSRHCHTDSGRRRELHLLSKRAEH